MKHLEFRTFKDFFEYFNLPKNCSRRLSLEETAYFAFRPYGKDPTIIRGYVNEFNHEEVQVSFKYKEFDLGNTTWSLGEANKYINFVDYYVEDD